MSTLPTFDTDKKKKAAKYRKIVFGLFVAAVALYGGIFYVLNKKLPLAGMFQKVAPLGPAPVVPAPTSVIHPALKCNDWRPYFFHDKLIYCDQNYQVHVKSDIDSKNVVFADSFSDGLARVNMRTGDKKQSFIYIDTSGKIAIKADDSREYSGPFSEGLACAISKQNDKLGFIDKHGKFAIAPQYYVVDETSTIGLKRDDQLYSSIFSSGLAPVYTAQIESSKLLPCCGYIDHKGSIVIPIKFVQAFAFVDERARVAVKDQSQFHHRWGYINPHGEFIVKPLYMQLQDFSEGRAAVLDFMGKWGYIDKTGKLKTPSIYSDATEFREGFAAVAIASAEKKPTWGYIRKDGTYLVNPRFEKAYSFIDGEAYACNGCSEHGGQANEAFWINPKGNIERHTRRNIPFELPDFTGAAK